MVMKEMVITASQSRIKGGATVIYHSLRLHWKLESESPKEKPAWPSTSIAERYIKYTTLIEY